MSGVIRTTVLATSMMIAVLPAACREEPSNNGNTAPFRQKNATSSRLSGFKVVWSAESKSADPTVNDFVARAVKYCAQKDYDQYRLLWRFDYQPTSRRHFNRLWEAVHGVEIKLVKRIEFRPSQHTEEAAPMYVFHAHVEVKPEAVKASEGRIKSRDLVLLIVAEDDNWAFIPAPEDVKQLILARQAPSDRPATQPNSRPAEDDDGPE